jgi:hypothetical protein
MWRVAESPVQYFNKKFLCGTEYVFEFRYKQVLLCVCVCVCVRWVIEEDGKL